MLIFVLLNRTNNKKLVAMKNFTSAEKAIRLTLILWVAAVVLNAVIQ